MSFSKFPNPFINPLKVMVTNFFYTIFEGPNVNEITSYFGHLQNKILDLLMCKKKFIFEFF